MGLASTSRDPVGQTGGVVGQIVRHEPRQPFAGDVLLGYLALRALPGVEAPAAEGFRRTLGLAHGHGLLDLRVEAGGRAVVARVRVADARDLGAAACAGRDLLDLDADSEAIDATLAKDPVLAPLLASRPGLRIPGHVDGFELAVRAVLGQQVSVAGARTLAGRLVAALGAPFEEADGTLTHVFPTPAVVAGADLSGLGLTGGRVRALHALAGAVADGRLSLGRGADPARTTEGLVALPGLGPWTASYVAMRALGDRDALPVGDLGLRRALERLGRPGDARSLAAMAERWRPWRAYGAQHLWTSLLRPTCTVRP